MSKIAINQKTGEVVKKVGFSEFLKQNNIQQTLQNTLQDMTKTKSFTTAIVSAVANNPLLQDCDQFSILKGALLGASLNLHPSLQLGQYYLIPFNNKKKDKNGNVQTIKEAQFVLGYRGILQLAIRSGKYEFINVLEIKSGELKGYNPLTEELKLKMEEDPLKRENLPSIGYVATFTHLSGFKKTIYWSKEKVDAHARKYSKNYLTKNHQTGKLEINKNSIWATEFDAMAKKTVLTHLLNHWGELTPELVVAMDYDNSTIEQNENGDFYTNNTENMEVVEDAEMQKYTADTESVEELEEPQVLGGFNELD